MILDRREFLKTSLSGAAALACWVEIPALARAKGKDELIRRTERPLNYESVRSTFTTRITPVERFYLRNHFDIPQVDVAKWRLQIRGLVEKPLSLSLADLRRMPQATVEAVLQCAGNGRGLFTPRVPGVQWRYGAMGNAEWKGVRLKDILQRAGPKQDAAFVQVQGAERPVMDTTPQFIRAIPLRKAVHRWRPTAACRCGWWCRAGSATIGCATSSTSKSAPTSRRPSITIPLIDSLFRPERPAPRSPPIK